MASFERRLLQAMSLGSSSDEEVAVGADAEKEKEEPGLEDTIQVLDSALVPSDAEALRIVPTNQPPPAPPPPPSAESGPSAEQPEFRAQHELGCLAVAALGSPRSEQPEFRAQHELGCLTVAEKAEAEGQKKQEVRSCGLSSCSTSGGASSLPAVILPCQPSLPSLGTSPGSLGSTSGGASSLPAVILPCQPSLPSLGTSPGSLGPSPGNHDEAMHWWDPEGLGLDGRMNGSCTSEVVETRRSKRRRPTPPQTPMMTTPLFFPSHIFEYGIGGACFTALTGISAANSARRGSRVVVCSMLDGTTSYEAALQIARRRILSEIGNDNVFYLGITENPERRFSDHFRHWDLEILLVEAASSRVTASMEISLLRELGGRSNCQNIGPGGETASAGSPHYLYLCVAMMSLMRRR